MNRRFYARLPSRQTGDRFSTTRWDVIRRGLLARVLAFAQTPGLSGVRLVISDQHAGLDAAIGRCFQGAGHQRCRVHFARNLMANIPKGHQEMVSVAFRTIFAQVSPEEISASGSTWPPCWPSASMSLAR